MRFLPWEEALSAPRLTRVIDVRSPGEFAEDHLPGAVNLPVLNDAERVLVGTLYKQECAHRARRIGGALVARNVATHLETWFADQPQDARYVVYCWRGGQRSRAMATILDAVGWNVSGIAGGYKAWRRGVVEFIATAVPGLQFRILGGLTGSGKSRLLRWMAANGYQILDLEELGAHRGSLLGDEPGRPQPSQKRFESLIREQLRTMDPARPIWVESESKRVGRLFVPEPLWQAMIAAPMTELDVPATVRAGFLTREYLHFQEDPAALAERLAVLKPHHGGEQIAHWARQIQAGQWTELVASLLVVHYDPAYRRCANFRPAGTRLPMTGLTDTDFAAAAALLPA